MEQDDEDVDQVENVLPFVIGIEVTLRDASDPISYGPRVDGDPRKRVNFTIRASLHELLASMAEERGCSRSHLLEELLIEASNAEDELVRRAS